MAFAGYPVATVAFYGPDDRWATKVAVGIVAVDGGDPDPLETLVLRGPILPLVPQYSNSSKYME